MIIIDGQQTELAISNFANLEELLVSISASDEMQKRIVTDILVNDEAFSELYPHQAEDIEADELQRVEIMSVSSTQMARDIAKELHKVSKILQVSAEEVSTNLRTSNLAEGLPLLMDTINVTRDFMAMVAVLRSEFIDRVDTEFTNHVESISQLLGEMNEVLAVEDWNLLADLLQYEFTETCKGWESILNAIQNDLEKLA